MDPPSKNITDDSGDHTVNLDESTEQADAIRAHFEQVRGQYHLDRGGFRANRPVKPTRYKGGKALYKSIEKPLSIYTHKQHVVDVTDPDYKRSLRLIKRY